mmetsp:Transcript_10707/g.34250  ORF Transcript_10707/g.34250 Transcript_10707/m.34250 type:complete len:450 (+) Transcript_10707:201-1550(+)
MAAETAAWIARRLDSGIESREMIAAHLASQPNGAALRSEAYGLLGSGHRGVIEEIAEKMFGSNGKKKKQQRRAGHRVQKAALNCLRCGYVTMAAIEDGNGEVAASAAFAEVERRLRRRRDDWPEKCPACGDALREQLRHGDAEDPELERAVELAARLVRYDRETASRTQVIDDQADWYNMPVDDTYTIDFVARKVVAETPREWVPTGVAAAVEEKETEITSREPPAILDVVDWHLSTAKPEKLQPGLLLLRAALSVEEQDAVVAIAASRGRFASPAYADGARLHCKMACFGLRWDPETNAYVDDGVPPVPAQLRDLALRASRLASRIDATLPALPSADLLLANFYTSKGRMGLHKDDSESEAAIRAGYPVISISIGAEAVFEFADSRPRPGDPPPRTVTLRSGDILLFGGESRSIYHGIQRILPAHSARPPATCLKPGRLNLTFRANSP